MPGEKKSHTVDEAGVFELFNEIGIIAQLSGSTFERNLPAGLNRSQFGVLNWFVRVDDEASPGRLATAFQVTGGAMTNTLQKLVAKGLVHIETDGESGRKKRVTLTVEGRAVRDTAIAAATPMLREFSENFPDTKLKSLKSDLIKIRQYLDELRYKKQ